MEPVLRLTVPGGETVEAPVAVWLSGIVQTMPGPVVARLLERVAAMVAAGPRVVPAAFAPSVSGSLQAHVTNAVEF
jgi:O-methyltransferase involved in polyketide biosynthesis